MPLRPKLEATELPAEIFVVITEDSEKEIIGREMFTSEFDLIEWYKENKGKGLIISSIHRAPITPMWTTHAVKEDDAAS